MALDLQKNFTILQEFCRKTSPAVTFDRRRQNDLFDFEFKSVNGKLKNLISNDFFQSFLQNQVLLLNFSAKIIHHNCVYPLNAHSIATSKNCVGEKIKRISLKISK